MITWSMQGASWMRALRWKQHAGFSTLDVNTYSIELGEGHALAMWLQGKGIGGALAHKGRPLEPAIVRVVDAMAPVVVHLKNLQTI